jgi:iron-sulfur cluster assembly accessory protein
MSVKSFDPSKPIQMSDAAVAHFRSQLSRSGDLGVRISVKQSGCSGLAYVIEGAPAASAGDITLAFDDDLQVFLAAEALEAVRGTTIDLVREGVNHTLKLENPNVKGECGCGESFNV